MNTQRPIQLTGQPVARSRAAFSLIELLVVIAIIGILAAMVVGLVGVAQRKARLNQSKALLNKVILAVEDYKSRYGHYPPDNPVSPATNQLFYELMGVYTTDNGANFTTKDGTLGINSGTANAAFNVPGFINAAPNAAQARPFLKGLTRREHDTIPSPPAPGVLANVHLLVVPLPGVDGPFNPVRYVSSNPTNNPKTYDLWIEYVVGTDIITLGNWNLR